MRHTLSVIRREYATQRRALILHFVMHVYPRIAEAEYHGLIASLQISDPGRLLFEALML